MGGWSGKTRHDCSSRMTLWLLIRRSLRFHARSHLGVVLGAVIGSAALTGALIVGDCVRGSLRERALSRLGSVAYAMNSGDRFFKADLSERLRTNDPGKTFSWGATTLHASMSLGFADTAVLEVAGIAARQDGSARVNQVNILGIDLAGWRRLAPMRKDPRRPLPAPAPNQAWTEESVSEMLLENAGLSRGRAAWEAGDTVFLNGELASQLRVTEGDEILLRIRKAAELAQDVVLNPRDEASLVLRLKVGKILSPDLLADFSLRANQAPPANAFLPLPWLSHKLGLDGRANILLQSPLYNWRDLTWRETQTFKLREWFAKWRSGPARQPSWPGMRWFDLAVPLSPTKALPALSERLENNWSLADAELLLKPIQQPPTVTGGEYVQPSIQLSSSRIFLEPAVAAAALQPRTHLLNAHTGFGP